MLINGNPIYQFKSVKARLTFWSYIIVMVGVLVFSFFIFKYLENSKKEAVSEKLRIVRDMKVEQINSWMNECIVDVRDFTDDHDIRALEEICIQNKKEIGQNEIILKKTRNQLKRHLNNHKKFIEVFIINIHTGETLVSTNQMNEGEEHSKDIYFTEPLRTRELFINDIYYLKAENKPGMDFSIPIYGLKDDGIHIFGVLVARVNLEISLYSILLNHTGIGKTEETYIVNKNAVILNDLHWYKNAPLNLKVKSEDAVNAASGKNGIIEVKDYRDEPVISAYTYISQPGWGIIEKQDIAEGYEPIHNILIQFIVNIFLLSIIIYFAANYHSNIISQPLITMTDIASKIESGDLTARNNINRLDEFGKLSKSFDEMADSLTAQMNIQRNNTELAELMLSLTNVSEFSSHIIKKLIKITDSCFGAFYIKDRVNNEFKHLTSAGLNSDLIKSFDAVNLEGELGNVIINKEIILIKKIPSDTLFRFKTVAGEIVPKEIITIPIIVDNNIEAFISLGSINEYSRENIMILNLVNPALDTAFSNLMANDKIRILANELQTKNQEITAANEELQLQTEELRQQTDELKEQTKELEAQQIKLEEVNKLKSEFLSNMSHELRTPLTSILGLSQIMISRGTGKNLEQELKYLKIVERNGTQLLNLINDLLDLAKIEANRTDVFLSEFQPQNVVNRIIETVRPMIEKKHLNLQVQFDDVPGMYSDEDKVVQIMLNLLYNAVKFTEKGGIIVKVSQFEEMLSFTIIDTGIGIAEKDLSIIFDEFRQVDGSTTRKYGGTGLGLAISLKIARLLKGDIKVESIQDKGSIFTLILPLRHSPSEKTTKNYMLPIVEPINLYKETKLEQNILVVEDNEIAAHQIRSILDESGFYVDVVSGGMEAINYLKNKTPDAIILDIMMPQVDGFQVLKQIRSDELTAKIPVLVLTAKELTGDERRSLKYNNVSQLVQKGTLNKDQLVECIKNIFNKMSNNKKSKFIETNKDITSFKKQNKPILIVEDNPDNLLTISMFLKEGGYEFVATADGNEAVKIAKEILPKMIFMDIQLPGISGLDATKQIKYDNDIKNIPIVAMTAKAMKGDRENILAAGCDGYISKPIDPVELKKLIDKWWN